MFGQLNVSAIQKAASIFDPATLNLTGWYRASFSGSPWSPTASAGTSGSNGNLTTPGGDNPPTVGTAVNGLTPAVFNTANSRALNNTTAASTFITVSAYSMWALVFADSISYSGTSGSPGDGVFTSIGGEWGISLSSNSGGKAFIYHYTGSFPDVSAAFSASAWQFIQVKYDGTNLKIRVNGGTRASSAVANISSLGTGLNMGKQAGYGYLEGKILEVGTTKSILSDAEEDQMLSYARSHYALALT